MSSKSSSGSVSGTVNGDPPVVPSVAKTFSAGAPVKNDAFDGFQ